jgi:branched-chain amino acid transport system ATP-binding protein
MLSVNDLSVTYGGVCALRGVSLNVGAGEIVTLIGANGAGKSSLLHAVLGLVPKKNGNVRLYEEEIGNIKTREIVKLGISLVTETRDLFPGLTVKDNLCLGLFVQNGKAQAKSRDVVDNVYDLFPRLKEREKQAAGTLSGGEQQMLAIGRALLQQPKFLLLDEPSLGLSPKLTHELFEKISLIHKEGTAVLLVEQKAMLALQVASRGYVLSTGTIVRQGSSAELVKDEVVRKGYFGE